MRNCLAITYVFCLVISGCSAPEKTTGKEIQKEKPKVTLATETISSTTDGISVVNFQVKPEVKDVLQKLEQFGKPIATLQLQEKLLLEGIQLRRVTAVDVPAIISSLGEVIDENYVWHGQIFKWRDLHQRRIDAEGMLITQQGIPYYIGGGYLSLQSRSWLINREDGYRIYLQLLPTWHVPRNQSSVVANSSEHLQSKIFTDLEFETLLEDDEAIVLAVALRAPEVTTGPQDEGSPPVRLGEALLGGPVKEDVVQIIVIEANIMPRG